METGFNNPPGLTLQDITQLLQRRRNIIVQSFVVISSVGVVITLLTKPVYRASARLLIDAPSVSLNTVDTSNPLSQILALSSPQTVSTQVELLQSNRLMSSLKGLPVTSIAVTEVKDTNLIDVTAESTLPDVAAQAPNLLLSAYIDQDVNKTLQEVRSAEEFARQQAEAAHQRLIQSEEELRLFKQQRHMVRLDKDQDAQIARVTDLTARVNQTQTDLDALRSQLAATRAQYASEPETLPVTQQSSNTARTTLRSQIGALKTERAGLSQKHGYTPTSAKILGLDAQIRELQNQLADEPALVSTYSTRPNTTRDTLRNQVATLTSQESALASQAADAQKALSDARARINRFPGWEMTLAELNREHDSAAAAYSMFSSKLSDLELRERAQHANATISDFARKPSEPVRPKRLMNIILSCLAGLLTGLCLALLQEFLDDRLNTAEEAERLTQLPTLGYVPSISGADARLLPQMKGHNHAAESYRVLRTNIHFASLDVPVRTLLVTSSNPSEGKSTTAVNLAFAMALDGKKVILVDTDLRRPSLHMILGQKAVPGLTDILLGHTSLEDALRISASAPNLQVLSSGSTPPNPSELLNSHRFHKLIGDLSECADIVVFDSPPVLATADAAILASQVDGTVFVIETGETKKTAARRAVTVLRQAHAQILGVAYNKIHKGTGGEYYYYSSYHEGVPPSNGKNGASPSLLKTEEVGAGRSGKDAR